MTDDYINLKELNDLMQKQQELKALREQKKQEELAEIARLEKVKKENAFKKLSDYSTNNVYKPTEERIKDKEKEVRESINNSNALGNVKIVSKPMFFILQITFIVFVVGMLVIGGCFVYQIYKGKMQTNLTVNPPQVTVPITNNNVYNITTPTTNTYNITVTTPNYNNFTIINKICNVGGNITTC